jgi:type I restriction enzyme, R subunit
MTEFKQIIGRGTRVRDDYGKYYFSILDYTGSAPRHFADPDFDGEPALVTEQEIDENGQVTGEEIVGPEESVDEGDEGGEILSDQVPPGIDEPPPHEPRKFYVDGGIVEIAVDMAYEMDADGKKLRVVKYTDYTAAKVKDLFPDATVIREQWADSQTRAQIIESLAERGIDFAELSKVTGQPDADPLDLLCHLAYNAPLLTRRERAERLRQDKQDFFDQYGTEARAILSDLLEKYADLGPSQFAIPATLQVPPISDHGNIMEIAALFGGPEQLRDAVNQLQTLLYAT